jgi:UDP-2-acetamido-2-deoxy-ribo-hexuluronate aminotransferase
MSTSSRMAIEFVDLKAQYAALRESINARIQKVLDHGQFILGPEVAELEGRLAAYTGAKHCVTCASGTEALLIALMALDIKPGDEVITTPFTFAATAEMIVLLGARPVFVDIEPDTCNIDAGKIEAAVTARTRTIMPVSLYGQPADMDEINAIAARRGLAVIEDAAQSFGATYKGRKSCNLSTIGCTSFFPSKPLGCYGDGGALFTNNDALAKAMREIRVHGQSGRYQHTRLGVGGRMDTIQCAVVLAKLERFDWEISRRIEIGHHYDALLSERAPDLRLVQVRPDRTSVYAQYTVMSPKRDRLQEELKQRGIPTAVHYPVPLHKQPAYARYGDVSLAVSESVAAQVISLPMHADMKADVQNQIAAAVAESLTSDRRQRG